MDLPEDRHERQRLEALYRYQVFDTLPDEKLDRLTSIVKRMLHVPIVLINLIEGHRTWSKSSIGTTIRDLRRAEACCAHVIDQQRVFTVEDLQVDPRFKDNQLVLSEHARAYAGAPLITPDGQSIGALAVLDTAPRTFTTLEQAFLMDMAAVVIDELELRLSTLMARAAQERTEYLAHLDALTGLPNRLRFLDRAHVAFQHADRVDLPAAIMMLDLDRFKVINDSLGHAVGDALLKAVSERLCQAVRMDDTVARFGGDEFVILLPELRDVLDAGHVATKLLGEFSSPFEVDGHALHMGSSLGISLFPHDGRDPEALVLAADMAMYAAKQGGRGQYCFYTTAMTEAAQAKLHLRDRLREALYAGELRVHYQPQVHLPSGTVIGVEALARWPQPDGSWIPPERFIPLAEENGLIVVLGEWVLREACTQLAIWEREGAPPWDLAVNVAARQWKHPHFLRTVQQVLTETTFPPDRLVLEVTESTVLSEEDVPSDTMAGLAALGVRVALDDFGTGFANLSQLRHLDIGQLKLDRSLVQGNLASRKTPAISSTVLTLGHRLGVPVVGEGVETEAQREVLQSLEGDIAQGFLFSRPLPPEVIPSRYFPG